MISAGGEANRLVLPAWIFSPAQMRPMPSRWAAALSRQHGEGSCGSSGIRHRSSAAGAILLKHQAQHPARQLTSPHPGVSGPAIRQARGVLNRRQVSTVVSRAVSPEGKTVLVPVLEGLIAAGMVKARAWPTPGASARSLGQKRPVVLLRGGPHGGMRQAARRWTSQMVAAMSSADSASSQPPSIHWKGQNRLAGVAYDPPTGIPPSALGIRCWHCCSVAWTCGERDSLRVMPAAPRSNTGRPWESVMGSGQFGIPWERMHWLNSRMPLSSSGTSAAGNWSLVPAGSRCWQAFSAALSWELLTPSCCALGNFSLLAPGWGSGKFGTLWARMHWEKATSREVADWESVDPPAFVEPPEPVDDGLALHAVSRAVTATAAQKHGVRARLRRSAWRICCTRGHLSRIWRAG